MPYLDILIQCREHGLRNSIHPSVLRMSDPFDFYQNNFLRGGVGSRNKSVCYFKARGTSEESSVAEQEKILSVPGNLQL
jgi:hypothetical protein